MKATLAILILSLVATGCASARKVVVNLDSCSPKGRIEGKMLGQCDEIQIK